MPRSEWMIATASPTTDASSGQEEMVHGKQASRKSKKQGKSKKNKKQQQEQQPASSSTSPTSSSLIPLIAARDWSGCLAVVCLAAHPKNIYCSAYHNGRGSILHCALYQRPAADTTTTDLSNNNEQKTCSSFLAFIDYLLKSAPDLTCVQDNNLGYTPLHLVCSKNPSLTLVQRLLHHCPPTDAKSLQKLLLLPGGDQLPIEVVQHIFQFIPNPLLLQDKQGKTPLFLACQKSKNRKHESLNLEVIQLLFEKAPKAAHIQDKTHRSPIDVLRQQGKNSEAILKILSLDNERSSLN